MQCIKLVRTYAFGILKTSMKRITFFLLITALFGYLFSGLLPNAHAQTITNKEVFMKAKILQVVKQTTLIGDGGTTTIIQTLKVQILDGVDKGKVITLDQGQDSRIAGMTTYKEGQTVVVDKTIAPDNSSHYTITDSYRLPALYSLAVTFFLFTFAIAGKKGLGALLGLSVSLVVIVVYIIPQMLYNQQDPLTVCVIGSFIILFITTFLAHGFSRKTAIAVGSTFIALLATYFLSLIAVHVAHLAGLGTEDSYLLELTPGQSINPQGLLLGGILIGTLGALNDITTTQVASIFALFKVNREQTFFHLFEHGISIGKEHIASLINTLILAYAGSSLPIFIFLILNPNHLPYWVIFNNESMAEEIVRTIAGSMGLMLSVPIATALAAWLAPKFSKKN